MYNSQYVLLETNYKDYNIAKAKLRSVIVYYNKPLLFLVRAY